MSLIYQWSSVFNQNMIMIIPSQHFRTIQKFRCQKHKHCVIPRYKQLIEYVTDDEDNIMQEELLLKA